jgi:hypothetical protein
MPLSRRARIAAALIPAAYRFRFVLVASRLQGIVMGWLGSSRILTEASMRDDWIRELTKHGGFPIPWRLHGKDVLDHYTSLGPVVYYTPHLPLCEVPLRVLADLQYPVPVFVADQGRMVDGDKLIVPGLHRPSPSLPSTEATLVRMRTLLQRGQTVGSTADRNFAGEFYVNPLRLAGRLRVPVIFPFAELAADGVVDVTFRPLPHPLCESEEAIAENLQFLHDRRNTVLMALGVTPPPAQAPEACRSRPVSFAPGSQRGSRSSAMGQSAKSRLAE